MTIRDSCDRGSGDVGGRQSGLRIAQFVGGLNRSSGAQHVHDLRPVNQSAVAYTGKLAGSTLISAELIG